MPWFLDGKLISREHDWDERDWMERVVPSPPGGNVHQLAPVIVPHWDDPGDSGAVYNAPGRRDQHYPRREGDTDELGTPVEPKKPFHGPPDFMLRTRKQREEDNEAERKEREHPHRHQPGFMKAPKGTGPAIYGQASHYNPYKKGWREGPRSGATSSGEKYNPNIPTAAIQQGLRGKFGGVHGGKPHYALVEHGGKKLVVRINDVMPYSKGGRIIDLNEAAMKHFDPSMKKGVLSGVKVTPLGTEPHHEPASRHAALTPSHQAAPSTGVQIPRYGTADTARMHPDFRNRLNAMYAGMPEHLQKGTGVRSGYRTPEHQAALLAKPHRAGYVGSKYGSKHVHGIAADLKFGSAESRRWIHENAHKYGLHFPMGYEPWHIEPIGSRDKK